MLESFENKGKRSLLDLGIVPNSCYAIERKGDSETFEEFDPSLKKYKIYLWKDDIISTEHVEPTPDFYITLDSNKTIQELEARITALEA